MHDVLRMRGQKENWHYLVWGPTEAHVLATVRVCPRWQGMWQCGSSVQSLPNFFWAKLSSILVLQHRSSLKGLAITENTVVSTLISGLNAYNFSILWIWCRGILSCSVLPNFSVHVEYKVRWWYTMVWWGGTDVDEQRDKEDKTIKITVVSKHICARDCCDPIYYVTVSVRAAPYR